MLTRNEILSRSIVAVDLKGKIYTINEYKLEDQFRHELFNGTAVDQTAEYHFQIRGGVDLRAIY